MIKKEEQIKFCRYYDGSKKNTLTGDRSELFEIERVWVNMTQNKSQELGDILDEYIAAGLRTFEQYDDTPATLKAVLFNRFCYGRSAPIDVLIEEFKTYYKDTYRK